jgi:RNA polymerase sigma-54 factor
MTPQLQQAIKLLQLSNIELSEKIEEEMIENPALEIEDQVEDPDRDVNFREMTSEEKNSRYDDGFEDEYFFEDKSFQHTGGSAGEDKKREFIEGAISREETLKEYLLWQLGLLKVAEQDFHNVEMLISYIDNHGYLSVKLEEIAKETDLSLEKLENALNLLQGFDPPGVGARDIKECLLIQLRTRGNHPLAEKIIKNYLNEIKLNRFEEISKKLKVSLNKVMEAFSFISRLEPYPGRQFFSDEIRYIIPDVIITEREGTFDVMPNNYSIPKLKVNNYYENLLKNRGGDKKIREFASEKVQRAKNFIHSIEQREGTLLRVTRTILEEQKDFFKSGPKYLKPLTLKDVSSSLDLHESTISRITSSKYVQTPFGVFPLKYFFSNPIPAHGQRDYSSTSIKEMVKDIIQSEKSSKHLSDQKICDLLAKKGIKIARRTVAKYRKELNILPSNLRRRT